MIASIVIFANKDITKGEFQKQMKNLKWIIGLVILVIVGYTIFNGSESAPKQDNAAYTQQLQNARKEKDEFFKTGKDSPIEDKATFKGLPYFEIDPTWKVLGKIDKVKSGQKFEIQMTGGETETYEPYGNISFEKEGKKVSLKIFINSEGMLFLPFKDLTSGKENYGAGRYIDLDPKNEKDSQIEIDFNLAYHPFCAYNHTFTCPLPPAENLIPMAVTAGEKL